MLNANYPAPWVRVAVLIAGLVIASTLAFFFTGQLVPTSVQEALVYQNALLLLVLGSAIIEHKFTKPEHSLVNSLMGLLTLLPVYQVAPRLLWFLVASFTVVLFLTSTLCVAVSDSPLITGWRSRVSDVTYGFVTFFGQARVLFSILLLFGVLSFYKIQSPQTVLLLCFWGLYLSIWPLGLPRLLSTISLHRNGLTIGGSVLRVESPNIMRVGVSPGVSWSPDHPKLCRLPDGTRGVVLPLYKEQHTDQVIGTGIFVEQPTTGQEMAAGFIYESPADAAIKGSDVAAALGATKDSPMIGFVVEESEIGFIRFELWSQSACKEGSLVWVNVSDNRVYYQVVNGINREETLESHRHGFQIAIAVQIGVADPSKGFSKYPWLPTMNSPVFGLNEEYGVEMFTEQPSDLLLGHIPNTRIPIHISLDKALDHHTAILGVTGSGKTELALDIIRRAANTGTKVICVDLTARYANRLADMEAKLLSIDDTLARELSEKLFEVETGEFGAGKEKKTLKGFSDKLQKSVAFMLKEFLEGTGDDTRVGIITLPEISNTKATLYITELYLSLVFRYARKYSPGCPRILLVLEEAHTVIPEATTMGLGDFESKGLVGKMAQIALQGRKYRVGLLVIAQRTATVSKTVLTQCNTVISFACIDETSLGFLGNVFGSGHTALIPNLMFLQAVAFGKAIRSQRPLVIQVPFDNQKAMDDA
ncbi:MAG TPA: DUF87 domain-containing protein [Blastocatellia bacterium]|nr:DUF87 domain-containing protein [Blastocatellia bacterium]